MHERTRKDLEHEFHRLQDGDRSALEPAFAKLLPVVRAFVARLVDPSDVDDATQLALEKVFSRASDFDRGRPLLPWVLTLAGWECRTLRTRRRRRKETGDGALVLHEARERDPETVASDRERMESALAAVADLSEGDRDILREAFSEETSLPRDAAFRKRKERALDRLRAAFLRRYGF